ncbi:MAG: hypothetical protein ACE15C_02980 [Phycisphaerae bacterium]
MLPRKMRCMSQKLRMDHTDYGYNWNYSWYGSWGEGVNWWQWTKEGEVWVDGSSSYPKFITMVPSWMAYNAPRNTEKNDLEKKVQIVEPYDGCGSMDPQSGSGWAWTANGLPSGQNYINSMPHAGYTNAAFGDGHVEVISRAFVQQYLQDRLNGVVRTYPFRSP